MSHQSWVETLASAQAAGAQLSNSTSATSILPAQAKYIFSPPQWQIGQMVRITGTAQVSNVVTTPGTLTLDIRFGSTVIFNGGAMQMSTTAHTTLPLWYDILLTCRAIGSTGNFVGQGRASSQVLSLTAVADSTTTPATLLMPNTTPAVGNNIDLTTTEQIDNFATFSVNTNPTNITLQQWALELMF